MDITRHRILVIGDDSRGALAIVRSLSRAGTSVSLASESRESIVRKSRAVWRIFNLPSSAASISRWSNALKEIIRQHEFDAIIPANETAWLGLMRLKRDLPKSALRFLPEGKAFESVYRKSKTIALAKSLSIPVPETVFFENEEEAISFLQNRGFREPSVLKPDVSKVWSGEYRIDLEVSVLETLEGARSFLRSVMPFAPVLIQEYVPGVGIGQEFLARNGEIVLSFEHERVHEPSGSGGSSYRKSVLMHPGMIECSEKLIRALGWNGVCMIEYRWDPKTNQFWLMEVNGRFWGSLPLAVRAGADFPAALISLELGGIKPSHGTYRVGLFARNLGKDFRWIFETKGIFGVLKESVIALFRLLSGREIWDTFSLSDPKPFFVECILYGKKVLHVIRSFFSRLLSRPFSFFLGEYMRKRRIMRIISCIKKNPNVLFVCYGNIARSPFAERLAKKIFSEAEIQGFFFSSCGYYSESGRVPGVLSEIAANEFGVSLTGHRSVVISKEDVEKAGVVFCMDWKNFKALRSRFSGARTKLFLLGEFSPDDATREVPDPWMK